MIKPEGLSNPKKLRRVNETKLFYVDSAFVRRRSNSLRDSEEFRNRDFVAGYFQLNELVIDWAVVYLKENTFLHFLDLLRRFHSLSRFMKIFEDLKNFKEIAWVNLGRLKSKLSVLLRRASSYQY